jgi:hypothetical protein
VRKALDRLVGNPVELRRSVGPGGAGVWRAAGPVGSVAVKLGVTRRELHFYRRLAPRLASTPLTVPSVLAAGWDPEPWIVLPWLPTALPRSRWTADPAVMGWLRAFHAMAVAWRDEPHPWFPFGWPDELTWAALSLLAPPDAAWFGPRIARWQALANRVLWKPLTVVHGDPNPTNWRISNQGRLVLLDWARYGVAHPALDVAVSLPGLPSPAAAAQAVRQYGSRLLGPDHVLLAKLYVSFEFLAMAARGDITPPPETLTWLGQHLRPWTAMALPAVGLLV